MRTFGRWLGRVILTLVILFAALWLLGPYEDVDLTADFDATALEGDLDAYFASRESVFDDITLGTEKRVIWAQGAGERTDWAVLYVHGFSATSEEIRPVPDMVASDLGANLIYTRLQGHGRGGDAMAEATVAGWMRDLAEGLAAARATGEKVLVISTSTGGTLVAAAAQDAGLMESVAGSVFVAPNFGLNNPAAGLLTFPAARYWLPLLFGETRKFEAQNNAHELYWTTEYPSVAVFPMAALVKDVVALDHSRAEVPALFWFSDDDQVVNPVATRALAARWGGPVTIAGPDLGPEDDPYAHVIAGDILSPGQTAFTARSIVDWVQNLE